MLTPAAVTSALLDIVRAATAANAGWALIGGQALQAHGVPRTTLDADVLLEEADLGQSGAAPGHGLRVGAGRRN